MPETPVPPPLAAAGVRSLKELDARPILAGGGDPFGRIVEALSALGPDEGLRLIVGFEPVPLYDALAKRGFGHHTERGPDAFHVYFHRDPDAKPVAIPTAFEGRRLPIARTGRGPADGDAGPGKRG